MSKKVYPYSLEVAIRNDEEDSFRQSDRLNRECAQAVDASLLRVNYDHLSADLQAVIRSLAFDYGFERLNLVLANALTFSDYDIGCFSPENIEWASSFDFSLSEDDLGIRATSWTLDSLVTQTRKTYTLVLEAAASLPGQPGNGEKVSGYEIRHSILFTDNCGFALATNLKAPAPFATWQVTERDGKRRYDFGHYFGNEEVARLDYAARIVLHRDYFGVSEKPQVTAADRDVSPFATRHSEIMEKVQASQQRRREVRAKNAAPDPALSGGGDGSDSAPEEMLSVRDQLRAAHQEAQSPKNETQMRAKDKGGTVL